jgi:hypothetical protein
MKQGLELAKLLPQDAALSPEKKAITSATHYLLGNDK